MSLHKGHSLRTDEWAFMRYSDDTEELYDMNNDPLQFTNLAGRSEFQEIKNSLATQLQQRLRDAQIDK